MYRYYNIFQNLIGLIAKKIMNCQLNVSWKVWKGDWIAQLCHSVAFQLNLCYLSADWMAVVHPVILNINESKINGKSILAVYVYQ